MPSHFPLLTGLRLVAVGLVFHATGLTQAANAHSAISESNPLFGVLNVRPAPPIAVPSPRPIPPGQEKKRAGLNEPPEREPLPVPIPQPVDGPAGGTFGPYRLPAALPGERALLTLQNGKSQVVLTRSQLLSLPSFRLVTRHAQLQRTFTYDGVLLRTLARAMGIEGQNLRIYAVNGFVSTIPAADYTRVPIMLALSANGKPISILEKGPLTVVLPSDAPRFQEKSAYWVWFVNRITPAP